MKVVIIEDENLSAEYLENLLKKIEPSAEIIARIDSVKKSIELFSKGIEADLLFVDVHLADGLSFDIFSKIHVDIPIIFTTAYDEYAIKAFKLNSVDYLLKPLAVDELKSAVEKFKKLKTSFQSTLIEELANAYQKQTKQYKNRFLVKLGDTISTVKTEEISHFISEDGMVILATNLGKRYTLDYTLDTLETIVDPSEFFRINRKVLIHINSVSKVSSYFNSRLKINHEALKDEDGIVSRERVNEFKKWLDK